MEANTQLHNNSAEAKNLLECNEVLNQYLESLKSDQLKLFWAPNCVLDWFGRSIRGPLKINDYLRNEVLSQYEHANFEKPQLCDAIEYKPTHMKSKQLPSQNVDYTHPRNKVTGIASLKSRAESDVEAELDDNDDIDMLSLRETSNKTPTDGLIAPNALTPPSSTIKLDCSKSVSESDDDDDNDDAIDISISTPGGSKAKRLKRSLPTSFSYLRHFPTSASAVATKRKSLQVKGIRTLLDDTSSDEGEEEEEKETRVAAEVAEQFTPLCYLEVIGLLHAKSQNKELNSTGDCWDRNVRIRISYRKRCDTTDRNVQFALIIYEHLNHSERMQVARRNLMLEFNEAASKEVAKVDIVGDQSAAEIEAAGDETVVATVATTNTEDIAAALETAAFTIAPLRTPTKTIHTPPATPKRKPRHLHQSMSGMKRLNLLSPSASSSASSSSSSPPAPKRSAVRCLRL